jgi:hypothetical protein
MKLSKRGEYALRALIEAHCGLRLLMLDVRNAIGRIRDRNTLAEIVGITLRKLRCDKVTPLFLPLSAQIWSPLPSLQERNAEPAQKITCLKKRQTFSPSVASEDKAQVKKARRSGRKEASLRRSGQPGISTDAHQIPIMDSGITRRESVLVRQEVKITNELGPTCSAGG